MIRHVSLVSSSAGNSHLISFDEGKTYIMLDCGIGINLLRKKLFEQGIMFHQIKAALISHSHGDHVKEANKISRYFPIYMSVETYNGYGKSFDNVKFIEANKVVSIGDCVVLPFEVKHDVYNLNFLIRNAIGEFVLYVTDTGSLDFNLDKIRPKYIIIEANFDEDILREKTEIFENKYKDVPEEEIPDDVRAINARNNRNIISDNGHLSVQKTINILKNQISLGVCEGISLCHVSKTNGSKDFHERVSQALDNKIKITQLDADNTQIVEIKNEEVY